ncbi:DegT/DnrJ/EryC1/StrS family aminotransferase [Mesorhizobium sp. M1169]|uniref:DegT/DnrJ/EryC1/StrS family aminotransferase n=1 Tax=Mesorhizobium sp. M1169 TaxID=2957066 RepID=UPI00333DBB44
MSEKKFFPVSRPSLRGNELKYVTDAVKSGWISSLGAYVTRLETEFANYCGVRHAVSVSNGTVALHLALISAGVGPGDEVIVPDLSFIATANAVLMAGAKPVFCDVDPITLCMDPESAAERITGRTRAIIPVHLYGHPAAMIDLMNLAERHGLFVIEDAAEAHGATLDGQRVGGLGHGATFSFYANKNMTTGEGGMIVTNSDAFASRCRHLRDHAMSSERRYWHDMLGYNYRMTNLQAAIGCAQFEQLESFLKRRRMLFSGYQSRLFGVNGIQLNRTLPNATNAYWMVCLEVEGMNREARDDLIVRLRRDGVDTRPYFFPMSDMPYLDDADTPVSHAASARGINLPTSADYTSSDLDEICSVLIDHFQRGW